MITLRPYRSEDGDAVVRIWWDSWHSIRPGLRHPHPYADWRARWERRIVPAQQIAVAVDEGGAVVGFAAADVPARLLSQIFVAPRRQRQGIGARLFAWAQQSMPDGFSLHTLVENTGSRAFYERHGMVAGDTGVNPVNGMATIGFTWTPCAGMAPADVLALMPARRGHFLLESGHHGDLWLDLELLCADPEPVRKLAVELAGRLRTHGVEMVCGPLVEGAFVALMVADELRVPFSYAERFPHPERDGLFTVEYRIPRTLRARVRGRPVAVVNDVINAGSAVRGALTDLGACGARPVAIGALLVLGEAPAKLATDAGVPLEALASVPGTIWPPADCPLCARGVPLADGLGPEPLAEPAV
jgi:orotate phosphoribosyltransferase